MRFLCDEALQTKAQEITGTVEVSNMAGIESLMKRGYLALEDGNWGEAIKYCNQVLDINPEYVPAYICKLCATISNSRWDVKNDYFAYVFKKETDLAQYYKPLDDMPDYQKAFRFADETYRAQLEGYNSEIKKRIAELGKKYSFYMIIESCCHHSTSFYKKIPSSSFDSICCIGNFRVRTVYKILRTGKQHEYRDGLVRHGELWNTEYGDIKAGDVAVFTKEEEQQKAEEERIAREYQAEQEHIERQRREEDERLEKQRKGEEAARKAKEAAEQRIREEKEKARRVCRRIAANFGLFLQLVVTLAYFYVLFGTEMIRSILAPLWAPNFIASDVLWATLFIIPGGVSLALGFISLIFRKKAGTKVNWGVSFLFFMLAVTCIAASVWGGGNLVGNIILGLLSGGVAIIFLGRYNHKDEYTSSKSSIAEFFGHFFGVIILAVIGAVVGLIVGAIFGHNLTMFVFFALCVLASLGIAIYVRGGIWPKLKSALCKEANNEEKRTGI